MNSKRDYVIALWVGLNFLGCATFENKSRCVKPEDLSADQGWIVINDVPFVPQPEPRACGHAVATMVYSYWYPEQNESLTTVRSRLPIAPEKGLSAGTLRDFFRGESFQAYLVQGTSHDLVQELRAKRPLIVGTIYKESDHYIAHYEVVAGINLATKEVATLDPRYGWRTTALDDFSRNWGLANRLTLVVSPGTNVATR